MFHSLIRLQPVAVRSIYCFLTCVNTTLRLIKTTEVSLVFLLSNAISMEKFLSSQIAITSISDTYLLFSRLCKYHFKAHINKQGESCISAKQCNFNKKILSSQTDIASISDTYLLFSRLCKYHCKAHINKQGESCIFTEQCNINIKF